MTIPSGFIPSTGKQNLMTSLNKHLVAQLAGGQVFNGSTTTLSIGNTFWFLFGYPLSALLFPSISVVEVGLFNRGDLAFDKLLGFNPDGSPIKGTKNQTLVEINAWARDTAESASGEKIVRELRDRIVIALTYAGERNETTGLFLVPPIDLKNYAVLGEPVVGKINVDRADNAISEKYIVDPVDAQIKRYKLLVRIFWYELQENSLT